MMRARVGFVITANTTCLTVNWVFRDRILSKSTAAGHNPVDLYSAYNAALRRGNTCYTHPRAKGGKKTWNGLRGVCLFPLASIACLTRSLYLPCPENVPIHFSVEDNNSKIIIVNANVLV